MIKIIVFLFIGLLILEDSAEAGTSSRRRRKRVRNCIEQVQNMPYSKIDCSKINRPEIIKTLIQGQDSICTKARSAYSEIVHAEKIQQLSINQCFGSNLELATPEEKATILKGREELKIQSEKHSTFLIIGFSSAFVVFFILLFIF